MYLASEASASLAKDKETELSAGRHATRRLQGEARRRDQVHPDVGQDRGGDRARPGYDGRLEAHRRTVGEKIGKTHLTYAQGAAAEIGRGDDRRSRRFGLPVSTTHVLSSGVAGTMAANGSGLQWSTMLQHRDGLGARPADRNDLRASYISASPVVF